MLKKSEIKKIPKDDHARRENIISQPLGQTRAFNRSDVITEGWYAVCDSRKIKKGTARSFTVLHHRFVIWRTKSGALKSSDAFCPHMGADLGNGEVISEHLRCYFHHWTFDEEGRCLNQQKKKLLQNYPVQEAYGWIWIFAGAHPTHPLPVPPGLRGGNLKAIHLMRLRLFAHHHVMMVGGIDLEHFKSVHSLDIDFNYEIIEEAEGTFTWSLRGKLPQKTFLQKLARFITGGEFKYLAHFAGGSVVTLTYGNDLRFRGRGFRLPTINLLWGCRPTTAGISEAEIFIVIPEYRGLLAPFKKLLYVFATMMLQAALRDDDTKAFPHMRFNLGLTGTRDQSVIDLASRLDNLKISEWTKDAP